MSSRRLSQRQGLDLYNRTRTHTVTAEFENVTLLGEATRTPSIKQTFIEYTHQGSYFFLLITLQVFRLFILGREMQFVILKNFHRRTEGGGVFFLKKNHFP